ncbi:unnamed protein product [Pedinophyceae sp. YPF-701]|nr:unnamed protein product [Pedinophyceae sp. YPF-701]
MNTETWPSGAPETLKMAAGPAMGVVRRAFEGLGDLWREHMAEKGTVFLERASSAVASATGLGGRLGSTNDGDPRSAFWLGVLFGALVLAIVAHTRTVLTQMREVGVVPLLFGAIENIPVVSWLYNRELSKIQRKIRKDVIGKRSAGAHKPLRALQEKGMTPERVLELLQARSKGDVAIADTATPVSGTVYVPGAERRALLNDTFAMFSLSNPLHGDVFPSVAQMEAEVIAMCASMMGGGPEGACPSVCGAMTSGGTESILSAVLASRNFMREQHGVTTPEIVLADTAHPAYFKAASYFGLKVVKLATDPHAAHGGALSGAAVRRAITRNTALVVASAPSYPHGTIDDVEGIAAAAHAADVCCHVDACLGGFVLPFLRADGEDIPPFDFSLPGVTSMSVDTHKFGMAHKGTSVVLYRGRWLRRGQYTAITDWPGGLYISPGMPGSRPGALVATAWAAMVHEGAEGYRRAAKDVTHAARQFALGVSTTRGVEVLGRPCMSVVAFRMSRGSPKDIYRVNELLTARGWHLNTLHRPAALHMCFTPASCAAWEDLLKDLREAVEKVLSDKKAGKGGSAGVYGMAGSFPDRGAIGDVLCAFQDAMLDIE